MPAGTEGQFGLLTQTRRAVERVAAYGFMANVGRRSVENKRPDVLSVMMKLKQ